VPGIARLRRLLAIVVIAALAGCVAPEHATPSRTATVAAVPGPAVLVPTAASGVLTIDSVSNFRDVAGGGLELPDGRRMATGVVYRSAKLAGMRASDRHLLAASGLAAILDLRTPGVAKAAPDPRITGATYHLVNLYAVTKVPKPKLRSVSAAKAYMRSINVGFVAKSAQRARVARTLKLIAAASGPVVVHCSEGKDRTGWISAVLQLTVGATSAQVRAEYLKSNAHRADIISARYRATKARSGLRAAQIEQAQLTVSASYVDAGLKELERRYGTIDGYLTRGLKLSAATITTLRARLVN